MLLLPLPPLLLPQPLWHSSAVSPTIPSFPGDCCPLLAVHLRGLLVDLLHRLGIREPDIPVTGGCRRALPLCAMPGHRLAMCAHACRSGSTRRRCTAISLTRRIALGRDECRRRWGWRRRAPSRSFEPVRQRSHSCVPLLYTTVFEIGRASCRERV